MEAPCPRFVYSSKDYINQVSRRRENDHGCPPQMSKFDSSIRSGWEERMQRGLFRYHLGALETRILPGQARLVAQLNIARGQQRRKPQEILSIRQDFNPDVFNFNKANPGETIFELTNQEMPASEVTKCCKMMVNVSPLEFGHSLIVPEPRQCHTQVLTPHSIQVGIECVLLSADPGFRVGFNSLGAFASVNHLHLHGYYLDHELAVESAHAAPVAPARGLFCLSGFPRGFLFYAEGKELQAVVKTIHAVTDFMVKHNIAHNLFLTRGCPPEAESARHNRRAGVRIIVWPRLACFGAKEETGFNVALCELAGHLPFKNREEYEAATEDSVQDTIRKYTLPTESFLDLQTKLICHLSQDATNHSHY